MASTRDGHEREWARAARHTRGLTVHLPIAQRHRAERVLSGPLKGERHPFISDLRFTQMGNREMSATLTLT